MLTSSLHPNWLVTNLNSSIGCQQPAPILVWQQKACIPAGIQSANLQSASIWSDSFKQAISQPQFCEPAAFQSQANLLDS